jgi:hypothetical protein
VACACIPFHIFSSAGYALHDSDGDLASVITLILYIPQEKSSLKVKNRTHSMQLEKALKGAFLKKDTADLYCLFHRIPPSQARGFLKTINIE